MSAANFLAAISIHLYLYCSIKYIKQWGSVIVNNSPTSPLLFYPYSDRPAAKDKNTYRLLSFLLNLHLNTLLPPIRSLPQKNSFYTPFLHSLIFVPLFSYVADIQQHKLSHIYTLVHLLLNDYLQRQMNKYILLRGHNS